VVAFRTHFGGLAILPTQLAETAETMIELERAIHSLTRKGAVIGTSVEEPSWEDHQRERTGDAG
jgi:hypothetical protein